MSEQSKATVTKGERINVEGVGRMLRSAADLLFKGPPCADIRKDGEGKHSTCLSRESRRPMTTAEKRATNFVSGHRPFWRYDVNGMCGPCRAYWYAENAANEAAALMRNDVGG
jgi:hypothetical protein